MSAPPPTAGPQAILLDIEGTTTPISFVTDVLFPYVRRHLRAHLERNAGSPASEMILDGLRAEHASDEARDPVPPPWFDAPGERRVASAIAYVEWLMDRDRKSTALKDLQGRMWQDGYARAELESVVFDDVPAAFRRWTSQGLTLAIFSSGSALAQQLLFRHSSAGDLTGFLSSYFDTRVGAKHDPASYRQIARAMSLPPERILFASDVVRELDAARSARMQTRLVVRPGNTRTPDGHGHPVVQSFDELVPGNRLPPQS